MQICLHGTVRLSVTVSLSAWICVSGLQDISCYGFIKVFESQLLTETFRDSAQARPKQALHDTSTCRHAKVVLCLVANDCTFLNSVNV